MPYVYGKTVVELMKRDERIVCLCADVQWPTENDYIRKHFPENYLVSSAFVVPFGIFFPFQHYGSFFGQWGNLFIWFAIGFALSQTNIILNRDRNKKTNG